MIQSEDSYSRAIKNATRSLNQGARGEARRWAHIAVRLSPNREEPWLILASVSSPEASVEYIKRAQTINPNSDKVKSMSAWAQTRLRAKPVSSTSPQKNLLDPKINKQSFIQFKYTPIFWGILLVLVLLTGSFWGWNLNFIPKSDITSPESIPISESQFDKDTRTPTNTPTATQTPRPTSTPLPTETPVPSPTLAPTATSTKITLAEKKNKQKKQVKNNKKTKTTKQTKAVSAPAVVHRPAKVGKSQRWVDIDLSSQRAYAYVGDEMVKGFLVSTGTWQHPTVTGVFRIYVKYRYADMSGPGYYLPDVPYVMYFYEDYGLHGTYWHHNFGTPMSHGCVNFSTPDSAWLYNFTSIGTVVNIHK
jgi:lipoprotein-anchoring transpeptidase ErfK/SrfK